MSDALSRNFPSGFGEDNRTLCNAHARREFVEVMAHFPEPVTQVLEDYATTL